MFKSYITFLGLCFGLLLSVACGTNPATMATPVRTTVPAKAIEELIASRREAFTGAMAFAVKIDASQCYTPGTNIDTVMTFQNLTDTPITFFSRLSLSPISNTSAPHSYTVYPVIYGDSGAVISFAAMVDYNFVAPNVEDFIEVPARGAVSYTIDFRFPRSIGFDANWVFTPSGKYKTSFIYTNYSEIGPAANPELTEQYDWNAWVGEVESNQIEICIENP
jgi:hypothetical protein